MLENCNSSASASASAHKSTNNDPNITIDWLMTQLQHHCSVGDFRIQSKQRDFEDQLSIQEAFNTLKLQLSEKDDYIKNLMKENEELKIALNDLHARAETTNVDKNALKKMSEEQVKEILKPYFTEGQIRCIVERRKYVHWSIDDYASAISLRSVSPKAYLYLRLKLSFTIIVDIKKMGFEEIRHPGRIFV